MRLVFDFMSWWISPAQAICCRCCKLWLALRSVLQTWDVCMCTLYGRSIHTCVVGAAANVATRFCKIKSVTRLMLPITNKFVNQLSNFRRTASPRRLCKCETSYDFARCDCKAGHQFRACLQAKHSVFFSGSQTWWTITKQEKEWIGLCWKRTHILVIRATILTSQRCVFILSFNCVPKNPKGNSMFFARMISFCYFRETKNNRNRQKDVNGGDGMVGSKMQKKTWNMWLANDWAFPSTTFADLVLQTSFHCPFLTFCHADPIRSDSRGRHREYTRTHLA